MRERERDREGGTNICAVPPSEQKQVIDRVPTIIILESKFHVDECLYMTLIRKILITLHCSRPSERLYVLPH